MSTAPTFEELESRLKTLLPEEYQETYNDIQPVSMGSAGLKYDREGRVAWDEIWQSFCDLAMAGGPPHKGTLLEPASPAEIEAHPNRYRWVAEEICRGIEMATGLVAEPSPTPGWVQVDCTSHSMTGWLTRAITMENIAARFEGLTLFLPAGPHYRIEKETKNVITSIAKTCHYWLGHTSAEQHRAIGNLFLKMQQESPLLTPALPPATNTGAPFMARSGMSGNHKSPPATNPGAPHLASEMWVSRMQAPTATSGSPTATHDTLRENIATAIHQQTGLQPSARRYYGWLGLECPSVHAAVWMMRILTVSNALSRREDTIVFLPINPTTDPQGETALRLATQTHRLAVEHNILPPN